ncbi:MAG: enoyl-CoA hydratase/isomerase family protein [Micrococcaceae bacterium]
MAEEIHDEVLVEVRGHLGILTLNRPRAANALNAEMTQTLLSTLQTWKQDEAIWQVLVRGAGERGLCAGGDIVGIYREMIASSGGHPQTEHFWRTEYELNALIDEYPKPYIALMDGLTLGGGIGISAHGSHRIVTERVRAGMPETTIGFVPDVGGPHLLARAPGTGGSHGLYAGLTGQHLGAPETLYLGLADAMVESSRLDDLVEALTVRPVDEVLPAFTDDAGASLFAAEADGDRIDRVFSRDSLTEIVAELERLDAAVSDVEPDADWASETLTVLRAKSPSSLALTFELIRRAAAGTLRESLQREFLVGMRRCSHPDFAEGVRAQVIDKDRTPAWSPATLDEVNPEWVDAHFASEERYRLFS